MKILSKYILLIKQNVHLKELYAGVIDALTLRVIGFMLAYAFTFWVAKNWGAGTTGIFILSILLIEGIALVSSLGLENSVLVMVSQLSLIKNKNEVYGIFIKSIKAAVIFSFLLSLIVYFLSSFISPLFFNKEALILPLKILSFNLIPLSLIKINSQFLRAVKNIKAYVFFNNVAIYLFSLIFLIAINFKIKNETTIYISFTASCFISLISSSILVLFKFKKIGIVQYKNQIRFAELFDISIPLSITSIISYVKLWIGVFIAGMFLAKDLVGIYGITIKLLSVFSIIIFSVQSITMPKVGTLYKGNDRQNLNEILFNSSKITSILGIPTLLLTIIMVKPILNLLGNSFELGLVPFLILSVGQLFEIIFLPANSVLQMIGKHKLFLFVSSIGIIVQVIMLVILVKISGIIGVAISVSLTSIFQILFFVQYLKRKLDININYIPKFFSYLRPIQL